MLPLTRKKNVCLNTTILYKVFPYYFIMDLFSLDLWCLDNVISVWAYDWFTYIRPFTSLIYAKLHKCPNANEESDRIWVKGTWGWFQIAYQRSLIERSHKVSGFSIALKCRRRPAVLLPRRLSTCTGIRAFQHLICRVEVFARSSNKKSHYRILYRGHSTPTKHNDAWTVYIIAMMFITWL